LGSAVAAPLVVYLATWTHWSTALILCGSAGMLVTVVMTFQAGILNANSDLTPTVKKPRGVNGKLLTRAPVLLALLFFVGLAVFGNGITKFGITALEMGGQASLQNGNADDFSLSFLRLRQGY